MSATWIINACLVLGLLSALVAGVFLSFSDFIMRGLAATEGAGGIESMQHINKTVFRSFFLTSFFVLVPATLTLAIYAGVALEGSAQRLIIIAAVVYLLAVFFVTAFGNVPMNQRLAAMPPTSAEADSYWPTYVRVWTWWNHVRSVGAAITAACLLWAATALAGSG